MNSNIKTDMPDFRIIEKIVREQQNGLQINTTNGADGIFTRLLKKLASELAPVF
ncbi:hypothetical protein DPMN_082383 [Dreissena polymorpha]|uniref:Uncharacterized protein n=1 Tax=Dreissena polymorpha TaxID=45954 RepID=A0A9D3Y6W3_DREPO|nr:hypothetical protein DPMN_082383 [Dreissena polymorpha]